MGNRAIITTQTRALGVYLHWNGGRDSVESFCKCLHDCGAPAPGAHGEGLGAIATLAANFFGLNGLSVGLSPYTSDQRMDPGDNGIYVLADDSWEIAEHPGFEDIDEQRVYDVVEFAEELQSANLGHPSASASNQGVALNVGGVTIEASRGCSERELTALLAWVGLAGYREPSGDADYAAARFAQTLSNYVGMDAVTLRLPRTGDRVVTSWEPKADCDRDALLAIDASQPIDCRLNENYLLGRPCTAEDLVVGAVVYQPYLDGVPAPHVVQGTDKEGRAVIAFSEYSKYWDDEVPGRAADWTNPNSHVPAEELRLPHDPSTALAERGLDLETEREKWQTEARERLDAAVSGWASWFGWDARVNGDVLELGKDGDPRLVVRASLKDPDVSALLKDASSALDPDLLAAERYIELAREGTNTQLKHLLKYYREARSELQIIAEEANSALHDLPAHRTSMENLANLLHEEAVEATPTLEREERSEDEPQL